MLKNIFFNLYTELGHKIDNKKIYASAFIAITLAFYFAYNETRLFNKPLLMFTIAMLNIVSTLYYAKAHALFVTRIEVTDINLYFYIVFFILLYCLKAETITLLVCINTFFVIRAIKNFRSKFNKFEIFKVAVTYTLCYDKFRLSIVDILVYLYFSISSIVILYKSRGFQNFYRANYQINFLIMFSFGLYCLYNTDFYLSDFITVTNIITISIVILLGVITVHMYVHMLTRFSLKTILFVQNELILLLIVISCSSMFMLLLVLSMVVVSFYIIDFDYGDKFYDPLDEILVDNKTWNSFIKKIWQFSEYNSPNEITLLNKNEEINI